MPDIFSPQLGGIIIAFFLVTICFIIFSMHRADKEYNKKIFTFKVHSRLGETTTKQEYDYRPKCSQCGGYFQPTGIKEVHTYEKAPFEIWQCNQCSGRIFVQITI